MSAEHRIRQALQLPVPVYPAEHEDWVESRGDALAALDELVALAGEAERLREKLRKISRIVDAEVLPESASDHHLMSLTYALRRVRVLAAVSEETP